MPNTYRQGPALQMATIRAVTASLTPDQKRYVIEQNWEVIPDGDWTDDQKIAFVVAAIKQAGMYPAGAITAMLTGPNPIPPNPPDYPNTKPNMYRRLQARDPGLLHQLIAKYRTHKHVPNWILAQDMWVGLVALGNSIDTMRGISYDAGMDERLATALSYFDPSVSKNIIEILGDDEKLAKSVEAYLLLL